MGCAGPRCWSTSGPHSAIYAGTRPRSSPRRTRRTATGSVSSGSISSSSAVRRARSCASSAEPARTPTIRRPRSATDLDSWGSPSRCSTTRRESSSRRGPVCSRNERSLRASAPSSNDDGRDVPVQGVSSSDQRCGFFERTTTSPRVVLNLPVPPVMASRPEPTVSSAC